MGPQHQRQLDDDDGRHKEPDRQRSPEACTQVVEVDVEHHDHEQEQHHHRAHVHQHQHDSQELGLHQQPDGRRRHEGEHQEQRAVNRVARRDHARGRKDRHQREQEKQD